MTKIRIHNAPKSLASQCDYRLEPKGFWHGNGRHVLSLYKIMI